MKVLRLDLRAFGPFTDVALDFPADGPGLHLIHGPNEAGKSTALRALLCLLFGFPHQKEDDFLHDAKRQRVGATLRSAAGDDLTVIRRRGRLKDLRAEDDETNVDPGDLSRLLGGVDRDRFNRLYLCGLDKLISGGEAVLRGEGDFGAILFGGAGLEGITQVLRDLRTSAEALFKPGANATIPAINSALRSLEQKRREAVQFSLPTEEWRRLRGEHDEAVRLRDATKAEQDRLEAEHRRLVRIGDALPLFARLAKDRADLALLGPVPDLPDDFAERHARAIAGRDEAARRVASLRAEIEDLCCEHDAVDVTGAFLDEAEAIERLRDGRDAHRRRRADRPELVRRISRLRAAARALLAEVAPNRRLAEVRSIQPSKAQKAAIRKLGLARATTFEAVRVAREALDAVAARQAASPPLPEGRVIVEDLSGLVERIKAQGDLDSAVASTSAKLRKAEQRAEQLLARLPGWTGTLDDLAAAPFPTAQTVARFDRDFREADDALRELQRERKSLAAELAEIDERLEAAREGGELPTSGDLQRARTDRDAAWHRIARAWLESEHVGDSRTLAGEYEGHVAKADAVADRLRSEADRVAELAALATKRKALTDRVEALHEADAVALARADRLREAWAAAWRPAGVAASPPVEMREWLALRDALLVEAEGVSQARDEAATAKARREESIAEIATILGALDEPAPCPTESAMTWVARAEGVVARAALGAERAKAEVVAASAERRLRDWSGQWSQAVAPLGLGSGATPEEAEDAIERLATILSKVRAAAASRKTLQSLDRETRQFTGDVGELARRVGLVAADRASEEILDDVIRGLEGARKAEQAKGELGRTINDRRDALRAAESAIADGDSIIERLRREARCADAEGISEAARSAKRARDLRQRIDDAERELFRLGGNRSLDAFAREAGSVDVDRLPSQLDEIGATIAAVRTELDERNQRVGGLHTRLEATDESARAATAEEEAGQWLAGLETDVEQYARIRLAESALRRAIDRYREQKQGPILDRISALFSSLTAGRFAGIALDDAEDDPRNDGRPVLRGVRVGEARERVPVGGMSEGTANALYLAVRLATLETTLDPREPLPFVVDDILVHFDDERASAALRALAELARRTQVLFFTHHEHLLSLAEAALRPAEYLVHRLHGPPSA